MKMRFEDTEEFSGKWKQADTNVHNDKSGLAETDIHKTLNVKGLYGKSE